ncbi:chromate transporter [Leptodesmis sp.]|uniref:chromate transporter n=1 Tax=Leptodesmis sp. TaxID=3100501 RepID=UPI0040535076
MIIVVVVQAVWSLSKKAIKDGPTLLADMVAIAAYFIRANEILALMLLGLAVMLVKNWQIRHSSLHSILMLVSGMLAQAGSTAATGAVVSWVSVFLFFLKIGSVLYGSGYVLLAFLQQELVERNQWLTSQQLLDAVAIGQITPGPVFTTATFIGYLLAGNAGALAGTIGIFLPAFVLVGAVYPWVLRLRQSSWASNFLDGLNAVSLGLMAGITYTLGRAALVDGLTLVVAILSAIAVFRFKISSVWLVLAGGAIGLASHLL